MTPESPVVIAASSDGLLGHFLDLCDERRVDEAPVELKMATKALLDEAKTNIGILLQAAEAFKKLPPAGAGWLALTLGSFVELGGDPATTWPPLWAYFRSLLPKLPIPSETDQASPEDPVIASFPEVSRAVVAHLKRMADQREALVRDKSLLEQLEELEPVCFAITWIREVLLRTTGTLVVLHPPSQKGLRLRYEYISNCFHLFTLLQAAVGTRLPGGRVASPAVVAAAQGQSDGAPTDQSWWHYGSPLAPKPDLMSSIWGEANVRSIPVVEGTQVMLLWPPLVQSRTWAGFFGPQIDGQTSNVILERELSRKEAQTLLKRLGIHKPRAWWQFWS